MLVEATVKLQNTKSIKLFLVRCMVYRQHFKIYHMIQGWTQSVPHSSYWWIIKTCIKPLFWCHMTELESVMNWPKIRDMWPKQKVIRAKIKFASPSWVTNICHDGDCSPQFWYIWSLCDQFSCLYLPFSPWIFPQVFLAALSFSYFSKALAGTIMKSSITQIERRFDLTSSTAGFIDGSFEMGNGYSLTCRKLLRETWDSIWH